MKQVIQHIRSILETPYYDHAPENLDDWRKKKPDTSNCSSAVLNIGYWGFGWALDYEREHGGEPNAYSSFVCLDFSSQPYTERRLGDALVWPPDSNAIAAAVMENKEIPSESHVALYLRCNVVVHCIEDGGIQLASLNQLAGTLGLPKNRRYCGRLRSSSST